MQSISNSYSSNNNNKKGIFSMDPLKKGLFTIQHFAGSVSYQVQGFVEKNRDALVEDLRALLSSAQSNALCAMLFCDGLESSQEGHNNDDSSPTSMSATTANATGQRRRPSFMRSETVTSQFKRQLQRLMQRIDATRVQYIRCLKPNDMKSSSIIDSKLLCDQLRSAGVIEAIRISRSVFPNHFKFRDFVRRFHVLNHVSYQLKLVEHSKNRNNIKSVQREEVDKDSADALMQNMQRIEQFVKSNENSSKFRHLKFDSMQRSDSKLPPFVLGKTKIYFASGVLENLERLRTYFLFETIKRVQSNYRRFRLQREYIALRKRCILLQSIIRKFNHRTQFLKAKQCAIRLQSNIRTFLCRKSFKETIRICRIILLQSFVRRSLQRMRFQCQRRAVIKIQALVRVRRACNKVKILREKLLLENQLREQITALQEQVSSQRSFVESHEALIAKSQEFENELEQVKKDLEESKCRHEQTIHDRETREALKLQEKDQVIAALFVQLQEKDIIIANLQKALIDRNSNDDNIIRDNNIIEALEKENRELKNQLNRVSAVSTESNAIAAKEAVCNLESTLINNDQNTNTVDISKEMLNECIQQIHNEGFQAKVLLASKTSHLMRAKDMKLKLCIDKRQVYRLECQFLSPITLNSQSCSKANPSTQKIRIKLQEVKAIIEGVPKSLKLSEESAAIPQDQCFTFIVDKGELAIAVASREQRDVLRTAIVLLMERYCQLTIMQDNVKQFDESKEEYVPAKHSEKTKSQSMTPEVNIQTQVSGEKTSPQPALFVVPLTVPATSPRDHDNSTNDENSCRINQPAFTSTTPSVAKAMARVTFSCQKTEIRSNNDNNNKASARGDANDTFQTPMKSHMVFTPMTNASMSCCNTWRNVSTPMTLDNIFVLNGEQEISVISDNESSCNSSTMMTTSSLSLSPMSPLLTPKSSKFGRTKPFLSPK